MRWLITLCCFLFATLAQAMTSPGLNSQTVDKVLVVKFGLI